MSPMLAAAAVAALLLFSAVPALADELAVEDVVAQTLLDDEDVVRDDAAPVEPVECENPDVLEVVTVEGLVTEIAVPDLTLIDTQMRSFLVDLGADSTDVVAEVAIDMTWDTALNDYDLEVTADQTAVSENAQPFDPSEEFVTVTAAHCQIIEVVAYNFFALLPTQALSLSFSAGEAVLADVPAPMIPSLEAVAGL